MISRGAAERMAVQGAIGGATRNTPFAASRPKVSSLAGGLIRTTPELRGGTEPEAAELRVRTRAHGCDRRD